MARGFLPVVALADQQPLAGVTSPTTSPTSSSWSSKGKGKGGKKGKGKGSSTVIRYPHQGAGKSDPKGRARANMTCLRCGQQGHWAANCPQATSPSAKSSGAGTKRPAPTEGMASSADVEAALLLFEDQAGNERPDCTMIDPGASAFLTGYAAFRRYLVHLEHDCGFPIDTIAMTKGKRRFQFGGDAAAWSNWSAQHTSLFSWMVAMEPYRSSCCLATRRCFVAGLSLRPSA